MKWRSANRKVGRQNLRVHFLGSVSRARGHALSCQTGQISYDCSWWYAAPVPGQVDAPARESSILRDIIDESTSIVPRPLLSVRRWNHGDFQAAENSYVMLGKCRVTGV